MIKTSEQIRKAFLEYFQSKKHQIIKSSPLIPVNDNTLIFVNAGMVQFKNTFLGKEERNYDKATTSQKCMRVSGKHNDLEQVGKTARHHTLFEMLGNFSFGDYFKEDAIKYGWEFLTEIAKLDKSKLWITIYNDDDEAYDIWKNKIGIREERIVRLGEKSNFWSMGDTGPCGPCSEIHIDQGEHLKCGEHCGVGICDCDRFLELWNLVFMQFNRDEKGILTKLPKPSIDTGMGLERITAVVQGKENNYDSDLFQPIIEKISNLINKPYLNNKEDDTAMRVIADHSRATSFLIADGVIPSNEGRGYVLRRIMRRAIRFGKKLGFDKLFFDEVCLAVIEKMKDVYPELEDSKETIQKIVKNEEGKFRKTLDIGEKILATKIEELKKENKSVIDGDTLFLLYDAYGFPTDLVELIANEHNFGIDSEGFTVNINIQKARSRENQKVTIVNKNLEELLQTYYKANGKSEFTGYTHLRAMGTLKAIISNDVFEESVVADDENMVIFVFDKTPYYAQSGGQVADKGFIYYKESIAEVIDVQKDINGVIYHIVKVKNGIFKTNDHCSLEIDKETRIKTARNHSATHLLQAALKKIVGEHIHQEGSYVDSEKLRFDFNHFEALTFEEIQKIEKFVNEKIQSNEEAVIEEKSIDAAKKEGATALFNEKYGDVVRTVKITNSSYELCGGTHIKRSGDIGFFKIISESSIASGIRRIEGTTGENAINIIHSAEILERDVINSLKTTKHLYPEKAKETVIENKSLKKEIEELKKEINMLKIGASNEVIDVNEYKLIFRSVENIMPNDLKNIADELKQKYDNSIVFMVSKNDAVLNLLMMKGKNNFNCGEAFKKIATHFGGKGGGKDVMAQGACPASADIKAVQDKVIEIIKLI